MVSSECFDFTCAEALDGGLDVVDQFAQLPLVILGYRLTCGPALRLAGHVNEATDPRDDNAGAARAEQLRHASSPRHESAFHAPVLGTTSRTITQLPWPLGRS
jgi:hypothetical protein